MNIELKKVSHNARLSEETPAYAAEVWVDGVKRGTTRNAGHGGPDEVHPRSLEEEIEAYAKTLPKTKYRDMELAESAESVLHALLGRHLEGKRLARMLKDKVVLLRGGQCFTVKTPNPAAFKPKPGDEVLNGLPFEDALTKFLSAAG